MLYVADFSASELWLIDRTSPGSEVGDFGLVGGFPYTVWRALCRWRSTRTATSTSRPVPSYG